MPVCSLFCFGQPLSQVKLIYNCDMEIITMHSKAYQELKEQINNIAQFVYSTQTPNEDRWLDSEDVIELLGISGRTLQRLRSERTINFSFLRGRCRYRLSEINRVLEERIVSSNPKTLEELTNEYKVRNKG